MEEAKQRFSEKTKVTKRINVKTTVPKTQSIKARKLLVAIIKTANGKSKEFKISFKSRTNKKMDNDDFLCKHTQWAEFTTINPTAISSSFQPNILLDEGRKQEQSTQKPSFRWFNCIKRFFWSSGFFGFSTRSGIKRVRLSFFRLWVYQQSYKSQN